ncbi:oxidoreductase [uncultured Maribacter sp.]|uniref:WD40/YVTN/BNR-like repeat-containing protein n=1 Tax=uncultured Maribacter sp. TaxID=431308 RepID=UPI002610E77F|nr:oxidoreductase [uncultured Maribacter sp.]
MKFSFPILLFVLLLFSCHQEKKKTTFSSVQVEVIYEDSVSIRAIEIMENSLAFAADKGVFGSVDLATNNNVRLNAIDFEGKKPHFRSVSHTNSDFFMLSIGSPALLYKTGDAGKMELVYKEEGENVFYDAMTFWNSKEGIAVGDSNNGCLSILITRDGGKSWSRIPCENLPEEVGEEGAFAASNTNIKVQGDKAWIATTNSRIYYSENKGVSWHVLATPILGEKPTQGIYSLDFYDAKIGVAIGGDYTNPESNTRNKAITTDGGNTWKLIAKNKDPGYKSCVQFVPNSNGNEIVAIGFTGISYSKNRGESWQQLSEESFYTIRFANDTIAYAAGKNRIAKLSFK